MINRYITTALLALSSLALAMSVNPDVTNQQKIQIVKPTINRGKQVTLDAPKATKKAVSRGKVKPPAGITMANEGFRSMGFRIKASPDEASGLIDSYTYGFGGIDPKHSQYPGEITGLMTTDLTAEQNFIYGYSLQDLNDLCLEKGFPLLKIGDTIKICVKANAVSNSEDDSDFKQFDLVITNPILGEAANTLNISFGNKKGTPAWDQTEQSETFYFLNKMLPLLKTVYGPPIQSKTIGLIQDQNMSGSNVYMADPNEVWMLKFNPQLTTHEFVHGMRDYSCLSTDANWHYDPWLMGFEEGFAQAVSYWAMNKFADQYPTDRIWGGSPGYYRSYRSFAYDFENKDILTTTDYWSSGSADATGSGRLRYEMGALAIFKIFMEDAEFPRHFNEEYYQRLNSNPNYAVSRDEVIDIITKVLTQYGKNRDADGNPTIEGRAVRKWIDRQRIFDCKITAGNKIFNNSAYSFSSKNSNYFGRIFYYETFANGSEWSILVDNQYQVHKVNGAVGYSVLKDWTGKILNKKIQQTQPVEQPDISNPKGSSFMIGSYKLDLTTTQYDEYVKVNKGTFDSYLQTKEFGLYTLEHTLDHAAGFPVTTREYLLSGDKFANFKGLGGAVIDDNGKIGESVSYKNGSIYFKHSELATEEGPFEVKNGVFLVKTAWVNQKEPFTHADVGFMAKPGTVKIRFVNSETKEESIDYRNINHGDYNGSMIFLLREKDMLDKEGKEKPQDSSKIDENSSNIEQNHLLAQNYPNPFNPTTTINFTLTKTEDVTLTVFNSKGEEIIKLLQGKMEAGSHQVNFDGTELNSGVYFYRLQSKGNNIIKKMMMLK